MCNVQWFNRIILYGVAWSPSSGLTAAKSCIRIRATDMSWEWLYYPPALATGLGYMVWVMVYACLVYARIFVKNIHTIWKVFILA